MSNRFFTYLLATAITLNSALAIGMSDEENYEGESEGELIERYTEQYIDIEEAKRLGLELKEVKVEKQENHDKLEQTQLPQQEYEEVQEREIQEIDDRQTPPQEEKIDINNSKSKK